MRRGRICGACSSFALDGNEEGLEQEHRHPYRNTINWCLFKKYWMVQLAASDGGCRETGSWARVSQSETLYKRTCAAWLAKACTDRSAWCIIFLQRSAWLSGASVQLAFSLRCSPPILLTHWLESCLGPARLGCCVVVSLNICYTTICSEYPAVGRTQANGVSFTAALLPLLHFNPVPSVFLREI